MLFIVTTDIFPNNRSFGVFDSYDAALNAIHALIQKSDKLEEIGELNYNNENYGEIFIHHKDGTYFSFCIECRYLNVPLM